MKNQEYKGILKKDISASDILENLIQSCLSKMEACLDIYYNNLFSDRVKDYQNSLKRTFNSTSNDICVIFFEIYEIVNEKYNNPEEILSDMYSPTSDELYIYKMFEKLRCSAYNRCVELRAESYKFVAVRKIFISRADRFPNFTECHQRNHLRCFFVK